MPATLTVVMPMYNSAATVAAALDSVIAQTFTDWRCVVVNDGSTDSGPSIVREYAARDDRVSMISQPNLGLSGARNTGLEEALGQRSEFIHFLDSDDWMAPRAYEWLIPAAAETGASYAGFELCGPDGRSLGRQAPISAPFVGLDEQLEWNRTVTHAHLFAARMIGDVRFDEKLRVVEDYDLWLRLAIRGERWRGVERIVCGYRLRPGSMSKRFDAMAECIERAVFKAFDEAARFGWAERIDLSDSRRTRVCGQCVLLYSTMEALRDPLPEKDRAAALMRSRIRPPSFTAAQAAQQASTALLLGACTAPDLDGRAERAWLPALARWWTRCRHEGWLGADDPGAPIAELAHKTVHPDAISASMLNTIAARGPASTAQIVVVGLEKNGRRLARHAAGRGLGVLALDDFNPDPEITLLEPLPGVRVLRDRAEFAAAALDVSADAPWLTGLTTPDAGHTLRRVAAEARVRPRCIELWNDHRERLGAANLEKMRAALDAPISAVG
jgi:glycosyltransferase involved in cell wall biosynthesis